MKTQSRKGFKYLAMFINDKSCKVTICGLKHKSDLHEALTDFVTSTELDTGSNVKIFRTDGGGEYTGECTQKYLHARGIKHELMMVDTPQHNGVAEWMNWTLIEMVCTLLADAGLPHSFWYDTVEYTARLHNVTPTRSLAQNLTLEEAWSGNKPNVSFKYLAV